MPRLKTLKLGGLTGVSNSGVSNLVSMAPNLQLLELNNIDRLNENTIDSITKVRYLNHSKIVCPKYSYCIVEFHTWDPR